MFEKIYDYCAKEWRIVKDAPLSCVVLFLLACMALFVVMSWHYDGRINTLHDQIRTYEVKLEVTSPNEAIEKMENLHKSLDEANSRIESLRGNYATIFTDTNNECEHPATPKTARDKDIAQLVLNQYTVISKCRALLGHE